METNTLTSKLKATKKMANKYLAKRITEITNNPNFNPEDIKELKEINKKCYSVLLDLFDSKTKENLLRADGIVKILSSRIEKSSFWTMSDNHNFYLEDIGDHYFYRVERGKDGYFVKGVEDYIDNRKQIELDFLDEYREGLRLIHDSLSEKEFILNGNYNLKEEKDRDLAESLITFLGYKKATKKQTKRIS